jgi:hypothetical protein
MADPNRDHLIQIANRLGRMNAELVYVEGVVTGLLITDQAAPEIRTTKDVDCIIEVTTRADYDTRVRGMLTERGFVEMQGDGIPICAWTIDGLRLDVMPTNNALGFSNLWYEGAIRTATQLDLGEISIRVISPAYFLATKLEAFESRGNEDFLISHDLEDIIAVIDGRPEIVRDVKESDDEVSRFLITKFSQMLSNVDFRAALPGHVVDSARTPIVLERIRQLAQIKKDST